MSVLRRFFIAFAVCIAPASAHAQELTTRKYLSWLEEENTTRNIALASIQSHYSGFLWANAELEYRGDRRLFCAPGKLSITAEQNAAIVAKYVREYPQAADVPLGMAMLKALQATFPC